MRNSRQTVKGKILERRVAIPKLKEEKKNYYCLSVQSSVFFVATYLKVLPGCFKRVYSSGFGSAADKCPMPTIFEAVVGVLREGGC